MEMINALISVFMGAVSGYYTNKLAISHLFTDISLPGGFSWKAVIKKGGNKQQLAKDLSEIAEDKIIGKQQLNTKKENSYLYQELSKKEVLNALDQCIEEIFKELENSKIGQEKLLELTGDFLKQEMPYELQKFLLTAVDHWKIGDFIKEETFLSFCEELWKTQLYPKLQGEYGLEFFIESFCRELSSNKEKLTLETIFGQEFCEKIEELLIEKVIEIFHAMEKDSDRMKMEGYLHSICRQLGIGTMVRKFLISLREKRLGELFSFPDSQWFCEKIDFILEQPKIQRSLQELFLIITKNLKETNLMLSDLLPEYCLENSMTKVLAGQITELQPFISDLYKENQEFISERLIQEMDKAIEEGTGNFLQNMVLMTAKDKIIEKMQEFLKEKMPEKIQEFLNSPSETICLELCHAIGKIKISTVIENISFDDIFPYLKKVLSSEYFLKKINNMSLSFIFSDDIIDSLSKGTDQFLLNTTSEWLKRQENESQIRNVISFLFQKILKKPFGKQEANSLQKIIKKYTLSEKLLKYLNSVTVNQKKRSIFPWIYKKGSEIYIKDLLTRDEEKTEMLSKKIVENIIETYKDRLTIGTIISAVPKEGIKQKAEELFTRKAADYLSIKPIVEKKVLALDEDSLCTMMQKFMGTQLKPLNQMGGVLGAMIGLLIWFFNPSMNITGNIIIITMICYGLIGVGTNMLALHGLFRPYHIEERKWLRRFVKKEGILARFIMFYYHFLSKIPIVRNIAYLGYIPEKKEKIAEQLASFVADNFLNPEDLLPKIQWNPEMVQKFLNDHSSAIAELASEKLKKSDWESIIKAWIIEETTGKRDFLPMVKSFDTSFLAKIITAALEKIQEKPIGNYINAEQAAEEITEFLQTQIRNLQEEQTEIVKFLQVWYQKALQKKTVEELLSKRQKIIAELIAEKFCQFFYGEDFLKQTETFILKAISVNNEQYITSFFHGTMGMILNENLDSLTMFLFNTLKKECYQYLLNHEEELVDKLDLEIQEMINTMADGMQLGNMASTMLGTKQLIGKVFHRTFIEPQFQEISFQEESFIREPEDKKELLMQECLSDELFDKNENQILEKIEEVLKTKVFTLTVKNLEEFLFASTDLDLSIQKEQWIKDLLNKGFSTLGKDRAEFLESIQDLGENFLLIAGDYTIGTYINLFNRDFLKTVWTEIGNGILETGQKPAMRQAWIAFFKYTMTSYLLKDHCNKYLSIITEDFLAALLQKTWKLCSYSLSMEIFLAKILDLNDLSKIEMKNNSFSILIEQFIALCKEKDSIEQGFQEFFTESIQLLIIESDKSLKEPFKEILDTINQAFQYKRKDNLGLVHVVEKIDFANIIYLAVMDMTDKQIEELLKGFAGSYFLSLKLSGAFGFVFGVPIIKWVALIVALGSEFVGKDK